jgi:hypothetical protein
MPESLNTSEPTGYDYRAFSSNTTNGVTTSSKSSGFAVLGTNSRTGYQNPRWKDLCRLGLNATTSFSGTEWSGDIDRSWFSYEVSQQQFLASGALAQEASESGGAFLHYPVLPTLPSPPASVISDVHNRCIRKFIAEVNAAQSSENLTGRSIKHFKHDMHSLIHPMAGVQAKIHEYLGTLSKVSHGKSRPQSLANTIASAYLEFKFGVEPFTDDITAIMTDMLIKDRKRNPSVPVEATASSTYSAARGTANFSYVSIGGISILSNVSSTSTYSERIKGAVRTGINDDGRIGLIQDNRLLPKDWLPTAFSILPYAWMVNYFTNIGDLIDAASFRFSDVVWACFTTRAINSVSYTDPVLTSLLISPFPGRQLNSGSSCSGGNASFSCKVVDRQGLTPSTLVPDFAFSIPKSPTPWINMMAAFLPRIVSVVSSFT